MGNRTPRSTSKTAEFPGSTAVANAPPAKQKGGKPKAEKKRKAAKPKQDKLFDTSHPKHKAIEAAANNYVEIRDQRMMWTRDEVKARDKLREEMIRANLKEYIYDGKTVKIIPGEDSIKVLARKDEAEVE